MALRGRGRPSKIAQVLVQGGGDVVEADVDANLDAMEYGAMIPDDTPVKPTDRSYVWEIPSGDHGYALRIVVTGAEDIEDARREATTRQIYAGEERVDNEPRPKYRQLTRIEQQWVSTVDPLIERASCDVTMDLDVAISENQRLHAENEAYLTTKETFDAYGIDIFNPQAWIDATIANAQAIIDRADAERDARCKQLAEYLRDLRDALALAEERTGFAIVPPPPAPKPDVSRLTVVASPDTDKTLYDFLDGANWAFSRPSDPLTDQEQEGLRIIFKESGLIDEGVRIGMSQTETDCVNAAVARLKTFLSTISEA